MARYLTCQEGRSNKFYEIEARGSSVNIRYGRIGSKGTNLNKSFGTIAVANKFVAKTVQEKLDKGYVDSGEEISENFAEAENESRKRIEEFLHKYRELFNDFLERDFGGEMFTSRDAMLIKHSGPDVLVQGRKYAWDFTLFPVYELFHVSEFNMIAAIVVIKEAKGRLDECPLILLDGNNDTVDPNDPIIPGGDVFYPENFRGYMSMVLMEYMMCDVSEQELDALRDVTNEDTTGEENENEDVEGGDEIPTEKKRLLRSNCRTFESSPDTHNDELEDKVPAEGSEKRLSSRQLRLARQCAQDLKQFSWRQRDQVRPARPINSVQMLVIFMFIVAFVVTIYLVVTQPAWLVPK